MGQFSSPLISRSFSMLVSKTPEEDKNSNLSGSVVAVNSAPQVPSSMVDELGSFMADETGKTMVDL